MHVLIPNLASLSGPVDLENATIIGIVMPSAWTTANLTFQASDTENGTYQNVYDSAGNELTVTAAASRVIVDNLKLAPLRYIKIRSGTNSAAVAQQGNRTIKLLTKTY